MTRSRKDVKRPDKPSEDALPEETNTTIVSQQWSGPLPPPTVVADFDLIVENGAERIFRMAEKQQEHRIRAETLELMSSIVLTVMGQVLGFILCLAFGAAAVYTAMKGAHWSISVALVGIPIAGIVKAFVRN